MNALFLQNPVENCGVYAYGRNLFELLSPSTKIHWKLLEPNSIPEIIDALIGCDVCVVNYQAGIGGILASAPFEGSHKNVFVYHDLGVNESDWDKILFSDPTMPSNGKWVSIGRPLPHNPTHVPPEIVGVPPVVGVHGFIGAWADQVVYRVIQEFEVGTVRLSLPFARYGDADGGSAKSMAERCKNMAKNTGIKVAVSHDFLRQPDLIEWLRGNHLNCYIRPSEMNWRGVSSAADCALAARRPIAVNRCSAFRHLHHLNPSICVEDSSLMNIIGNGLEPLIKVYNDWSSENVRKQVEDVLLAL